jgi:DNA-directed RNA polymerase subunit RPC12/RpoP
MEAKGVASMFFIGIFGIENKEKDIKTFGVVCPDCGRMTSATLLMTYTYFHIFFIPTFRWNKRYFIKLRCCGAMYEAPADYAEILKNEEHIDFSRLKKVSGGFGGFNDYLAVCRSCGKSFDKSFPHCPYCGAKQ